LGPQKIPDVIELSFSRYFDAGRSESDYPTALDQPNNPQKSDYHLLFSAACPKDFV
jgi:hypothetical protein